MRDWAHVAVARDLYRHCVDEDPSFAPAWAKLGRCHRLLAKYYLERPEENLARADEAYRRALELDPGLPVAHKLYAHREAQRLDPHISTSVVFTWWARGEMERIVAATSDADDFELRVLAFEALGRRGEARTTLQSVPAAPSPPVFTTLVRGLAALLDGRLQDAGAVFAQLIATHTDPEALYVYGACEARVGDTAGALAALTASVEKGFTVPQGLSHPWLDALPRAALDPLVECAESARAEAVRAFQEAGGPALLGTAGLWGGGMPPHREAGSGTLLSDLQNPRSLTPPRP